MSEDLFRLCVIRPPLTPDPRYPPILLGQQSDFQVGLGTAVNTNPDDPRTSLEQASATYVASPNFAPLDVTDPNNVKLEQAAKAIDVLTDSETPLTPSSSEDGNNADPNATAITTHESLVKALKQAFGIDDLAGLASWFDPLETRLKDSIVALRLLGIEQDTGNLAALTRRLRTIEVVRKTLSDQNFPFDDTDLERYDLRPLLAPTFADLKSIFSTAKAREEAAKSEAGARLAAQAKIDNLYAHRWRLADAMKSVVRLTPNFRRYVEAAPFKPPVAPVDLTHITLANQHLKLVDNLATLTLKSFEKGLGGATVIPRLDRASQAAEAAPRREAALEAEAAVASFSAIANPLVNMSKTILDALNSVPKQPAPTPELPVQNLTPYTLLPTALQQLPADTIGLLKEISLDITSRPVDTTVNTIKQQLISNAQALDATYAPYTNTVAKVQHVGGLRVQYKQPVPSRWSNGFSVGDLKPPRILAPGLLFPRPAGRVTILGVADLLVTKQQLVGYEGGDVAYIENILKGETKSREVGTVTRTETEITNETETTESRETDTTQAERFEVSNESDKTIKEEASTKAGVTVSASYGPTFSVSANASFSSDRSKNEATKAASRYSKDITTKATDKIAKRVLQRTVTKTSAQTTTKDLHKLANTNQPGAHISGVYQWINKVYEAQTWNYGKRTILDFMIPEPGAFYLDKQTDPSETANSLLAVPAFTASPADLTLENYIGYAVQYGVTDLDPPPPEMSRASASYAAGKDEPHAKADKIPIPVGFQVSGISATASGVKTENKTQNWVIVTCGSFQWGWDPASKVIGYVTIETSEWLGLVTNTSTAPILGQGTLSDVGVAGVDQLSKEQTEIPWSVTAAYMDNFCVTLELFLERTSEAEKNWQNKTWARLRAASDKIIADQNAAIEKAQFNSAFQGRNPDKNKTIMRDEMKKNCISVMTDSHFDHLGAIQTSIKKADPGGLPISEINIDAAWDQGPFVRFFEQAFEWDEMTWILYPYFWGRKDHWYRRVDYEDEDPEFEKFVQAGSARANVPVRPGFEGALEHYLGTGKVWNGGPLPGISSPLFLPLAMEIQESLGKKADKPARYGEPWLVKVPTNLLRLRKDDKAPVWVKDKVSEEWVEGKDVPA